MKLEESQIISISKVLFFANPLNAMVENFDFARKELARVRATAMEGSFGTQKKHYDLRRVKARTKLTEILYIFFGIHTANVVRLADRIEESTSGDLLKRKQAHRKVLSRENYASVIENGQIIRPKRPE